MALPFSTMALYNNSRSSLLSSPPLLRVLTAFPRNKGSRNKACFISSLSYETWNDNLRVMLINRLIEQNTAFIDDGNTVDKTFEVFYLVGAYNNALVIVNTTGNYFSELAFAHNIATRW